MEYNCALPGLTIRFREGIPMTVDLFNDKDAEERVHSQGQIMPAEVDGAAEEKSRKPRPKAIYHLLCINPLELDLSTHTR